MHSFSPHQAEKLHEGSSYWLCPGCGYQADTEEQRQKHLAQLPRWFVGSSMVPRVEHLGLFRAILEAF